MNKLININCVRTDYRNEDFKVLVRFLDAYLKDRDGDEHSFYAQYNKIDAMQYVIVAYINSSAVGCGALKEFSDDTMEVKRMFVLPEFRSNGIASKILSELEKFAGELGCKHCILETGKKQLEAIALYKKNGYRITSNFGQYAGMENSVCFEKSL
jgi:putative acetyltransferase